MTEINLFGVNYPLKCVLGVCTLLHFYFIACLAHALKLLE